MAVLRRAGDLQVELEVGRDRVPPRLDGRDERIQRPARRGAARLSAVRRWAARPAASVSTPMRSSGTATTSCSVPGCSGVMLNGGPSPGPMMKLPMPWHVSIRPAACSLAHDGAADVEGRHDGRLGGQLVAGLQLACADALAEAFDPLQGQRARPTAGDRGVNLRVIPEFCLARDI